MGVTGEFELEILVNEKPLRELCDGDKIYIIGKEGLT